MFRGLFRSARGLIGFDFGSVSLRALQLRNTPEGLSVVGAAQLPCACAIEDLPRRERLESVLAHAGFRGRRCAVSLPRSDIRIQSVRMPVMPDSELAEAVAWEAAERFSIDRKAMETDYIRAGVTMQGSDRKDEVILVAVSHDLLMPRLDLLLSAGLLPVAVDTGFGALGRLFSRRHRRQSDERDVRALIDIGHTGSSLVILRGSVIAYVKPLPIGGAMLDRAVAERLDIEVDAAAGLRAGRMAAAGGQAGEAADPTIDRLIFDAVRPLLSDLLREVVLCMRYYGVTFRGEPPRQLILTGGNGREPGFAQMLHAGCKLKVVHDDAAATLGGLSGELAQRLRRDPGPVASWAVAAGLSLRYVDRPLPKSRDEPAPADAERQVA